MAMTPEERKRRLHMALGSTGSDESDIYNQGRAHKEIREKKGSETDQNDFVFAEPLLGEREYRDNRHTTEKTRSMANRNHKTKSHNNHSKSNRNRKEYPIEPWKILTLIGVIAFIVVLFTNIGSKKQKEKLEALNNEEANEIQIPGESTVVEDFDLASYESELAIADAKAYMLSYDYDEALNALKNVPDYESDAEITELISEIENTKASLIEVDPNEITHVFFHILTVDPALTFDNSKWGKQADGYNSLMTTTDEFRKMLDEMYNRGFVLVSLHDIVGETTAEDGSKIMTKKSIMLPEGKKAFVMSEDDVCYYEYMKGAGFSDKMVVGEDGRPTNHYIDRDGVEHIGEYDLVPILDKFIDEHPDFSYKGHKACLVFTGYNGILGYRTDESYDPNSEYYDEKLEQGHDVEAERKEAVKVLKALRDDGYDLGSHSWGHRDMGELDMDRFIKDADRWDRNVASLIKEATGETPDILIFPKGADIGDWHPYSSDNSKFNYMYDLGFRYYCNVDSSKYWVQMGDRFFRQGRRALDGYNMWRDLSGEADKLSDLFTNINAIFDEHRPTPVPGY